MIQVKIKKIREVKTPSYAHKGDAGVDLYAAEDCVIKPMERKLVPTGIKMAIPEGYEGQLRPKSGLAIEHGIGFVNSVGTIDSTYRGEIKVPCINLGNEEFKIERNNKIAQMVFNKVEEVYFEEVDELDETARNEGGFGSTGLK
jgi:dUTP pyrophosphatase